MLVVLFAVSLVTTPSPEYFVSTAGNDQNPGTVDAPFRTLARALLAARYDGAASSVVSLCGPSVLHRLTEPINLEPTDSGLTVRTAPGEPRHTLHGGLALDKWRLDNETGAWVHDVPMGVASRQLFFNGQRANRSRSETMRLRASRPETAFESSSSEALGWRNPREVELVFRGVRGHFTEQRCTVERVSAAAGNRSRVLVWPKQPCYFNVQLSAGGGAGGGPPGQVQPTSAAGIMDVNASVAFIENVPWPRDASDFASSPEGTWYLDRAAAEVRYKPTAADIAVGIGHSSAVLPVLERLVQGGGTPDAPLFNVTFDNVGFRHTTWLEPDGPDGYVPQQAAVRLVGATTGIVGDGLAAVTGMPCQNLLCEVTPGAVSLGAARALRLLNCSFDGLGAAALWLHSGAQDCAVVGCEFSDLSAGAVSIGRVDTHDVTDPSRQERRNVVAHNYIHGVGSEYHGAAAVWGGFVADTLIEHNTVEDTSYSAFHIGWGWRLEQGYSERNTLAHNRVLRHMREMDDGGGLYTSGPQPGSRLYRNYVSGRVQRRVGGCLYHDDGSSGFVDEQNVCDEPPGLASTCCGFFFTGGSPAPPYTTTHDINVSTTFTTALILGTNNSHGVRIEDTIDCRDGWPPEALAVIATSGYQPPHAQPHWPRS